MTTQFLGCSLCLFVRDSETGIWMRALPNSIIRVDDEELNLLMCNRFGTCHQSCARFMSQQKIKSNPTRQDTLIDYAHLGYF